MAYIADLIRSGVDHYNNTFGLQMFTMLYIMFAYNNIVQSGVNLTSELTNNFFAGDTVMTIILMVSLILVERVTYLYRSLLCKVWIQYMVCLGSHW